MWINENTPYKGSYLPRANHSCFVLATSENEDLKQESKTAFVLVVLCSTFASIPLHLFYFYF